MYTPLSVVTEAALKADAIQHNFCVGCGLCALNCPTSAIVMEEQPCVGDQIRKAPSLKGHLCVHCGRCAAVCPSGTIQQQRMELLLLRVKSEGIRAVAFFCTGLNLTQSTALECGEIPEGMSLMDSRLRPRMQDVAVPEGVLLEEVRCTGRLGARFLLRLLEAGARDVAFIPCGPAQCQYGQGGTGIREHVWAVQDTLAQYGVSGVRLAVHEHVGSATELEAVLRGLKVER